MSQSVLQLRLNSTRAQRRSRWDDALTLDLRAMLAFSFTYMDDIA
jgi:hypothetical protein